MRRLLPILTVLLISIAIYAQDSRWIYILSSNDGEKYYSDKTFKRLSNDDIVIWIKIVRQLGGYSLDKNEYDCANDRFRVLSHTRYDSAGKVVISTDRTNEQWQAVVPDSVGEGVFEFICKAADRKDNN